MSFSGPVPVWTIRSSVGIISLIRSLALSGFAQIPPNETECWLVASWPMGLWLGSAGNELAWLGLWTYIRSTYFPSEFYSVLLWNKVVL